MPNILNPELICDDTNFCKFMQFCENGEDQAVSLEK